MQELGCPESFTEPRELYDVARLRGMDAVTIADHNTIAGALAIADLPHVFISCEYTVYFPEDRRKVHVLAFDINEEHHEQLLEARQDIYRFTNYLNENHIAHACAHPLYSPNDHLDQTHIEKLLLLYHVWEWNGDLAPAMNQAMRSLTQRMTPEKFTALRDRHDITPYGCEPWRKRIIAGSDDHSSLTVATTYTEVPGASDFKEFWTGILQMQARIHAVENTPHAMARNVYSIGYQFYRRRFKLQKYVKYDTFLLFSERMLRSHAAALDSRLARFHRYLSARRQARQPIENMSLLELAQYEAANLIHKSPELQGVVEQGIPQGADPNHLWHTFVNTLANTMLIHLGKNLAARLAHARLFDLFHSLGSAAALYAVLVPYVVGYSHFVRQNRQARHLLATLAGDAPRREPGSPHVAHFTDTFFEDNGIARTLRRQLAIMQALNKNYSVVACAAAGHCYVAGLRAFSPVGAWQLPEYPEIELYAPPFLALLQYCYEEGFTHVHASTPGPMGFAALGVARVLQLPVTATHHASMPQYGRALTEDSYVEGLLWKSIIAFYSQLNMVFAPTVAAAEELAARGLRPEKIRIYPQCVDTDWFCPERKDMELLCHYTGQHEGALLLYTGDVSKNYGLDVLTDAFRQLHEQDTPVQLLVIGSGPYRAEMETALADYPASFADTPDGATLARLHASVSIFVSPCATDPFGIGVLEAQASGVPVIVADAGGAHENMAPNKTGVVFRAGDTGSLVSAIQKLLRNPSKRKQMGAAARAYAVKRDTQEIYGSLYDVYASADPDSTSPELDIVSALQGGVYNAKDPTVGRFSWLRFGAARKRNDKNAF